MSKRLEELAEGMGINYKSEVEITGKEKEEILKKYDAKETIASDLVVKSVRIPITDSDEISKYTSMKESELPQDIVKVLNGNYATFYKKTSERKVYKEITMTDEELKIEIECQKTTHLDSMAKSLRFFVIVTVILLAIGVIVGIIALASA